MLVMSPRLSAKSSLPSSLKVGDSQIQFSTTVRNLGVTLDSNLNMSQHVTNVCRAAYIQLRQISSIRHYLTPDATKTLICAFVLSRLDYCNSLLAGCPMTITNKLQRVQNAAARLVCKAKKSDHISPLLKSLHWLPITSRIHYKIGTICYNSIAATGPLYISDLLQQYTPTRQLRSSSDTRVLRKPRVSSKTFGERTFSHIGPTTWNNLPHDIRHSSSRDSFCSRLKTHLFKLNFDH